MDIGGDRMDKENKNTCSEYNIEDVGQVQIAEEVIAVIASIAATEVEGVAKMSGNITSEIAAMVGMKNLSKGVKIRIDEEKVDINLSLIMDYGVSIPKISREVQDRVKNSIETMTGLEVSEVNIHIAGIQMEP